MSAISIDFNQPLLFLDGNPIMEPSPEGGLSNNPVIISKMLANNLAQGKNGGMKIYFWALELYKSGVLVLDKPDRELLKKEIESMGVSTLVAGRVFELIENAEKIPEKPTAIKKV